MKAEECGVKCSENERCVWWSFETWTVKEWEWLERVDKKRVNCLLYGKYTARKQKTMGNDVVAGFKPVKVIY